MPNAKKHKDLIPATRDRLRTSGLPYVIENVPGAPLLPGWNSIILCGTMFNLITADGKAELRRHRFFELSFYPGLTPDCRHNGIVIGVYGGHGRDRRRSVGVWGHAGGSSRRDGLQAFSTKQRGEAMGIGWMTGAELSQAIPPAYTFWIGTQLMSYLKRKQTNEMAMPLHS
jgi:DNA (cytosine-5)-methyltransferase 1